MSNDLMLTKGSRSLVDPAERRKQVLARVSQLKDKAAVYTPWEGGVNYIQLNGNTGDLTYGRDKHDLPADQEFVVPFELMSHGVHKWMGGAKVQELMRAVLDGPAPTKPEGPDEYWQKQGPKERDGWQEVVTIRLVGVGGTMDKVELSFDGKNETGRNAVKALIGECFQACETSLGEKGYYNPVIRFAVDSYPSKEYKKDVYFPKFEIVGWCNGPDIIELSDSEKLLSSGGGDAAGASMLDMD